MWCEASIWCVSFVSALITTVVNAAWNGGYIEPFIVNVPWGMLGY